MREVFWELLEEKPYSAITVKLITQRAGVNHNTFYYHFQNIDDMAMRFFVGNVPTKLVDMVVDAFMGWHNGCCGQLRGENHRRLRSLASIGHSRCRGHFGAPHGRRAWNGCTSPINECRPKGRH